MLNDLHYAILKKASEIKLPSVRIIQEVLEDTGEDYSVSDVAEAIQDLIDSGDLEGRTMRRIDSVRLNVATVYRITPRGLQSIEG